MKIEYHPALEGELNEIRRYYNECSQSLGDDFVNQFEKQLLRIASMPTRWMIVRGDIRRALMKRFPYLILFRISNPDTLRVIVVKHERRHPGYGLHRR